MITEGFYWDLNDGTRAYARRARVEMPDAPPAPNQAGCYSATLHYPRAVAGLGAAAAKADGVAAVGKMKSMPFEDDALGTGHIRVDGRCMVMAYLFQVNTPAESTGEWDLYKLVATVPPEQPFRPLSEDGCPFVRV
jgi:branched-chain amino acid transport system substrate-binding protein